MANNKFPINRAAVLTLWATVVAERLGHGKQEALTLGRAVAGLNAQSKGRRIGIYPEKTPEEKEKEKKEVKASKLPMVNIMGRSIPVMKTPKGMRAAVKGEPIDPEGVETYLEGRFGEHLDASRAPWSSSPILTRLASWKPAPTTSMRSSVPRFPKASRAGAPRASLTSTTGAPWPNRPPITLHFPITTNQSRFLVLSSLFTVHYSRFSTLDSRFTALSPRSPYVR